jgi:hypothetical protein
MPIVINEIVIKTNVEIPETTGTQSLNTENISVEEIVKQSVAKVLEILDEKKER